MLRPHPSLSLGGKFPAPLCCDAPVIIKTSCWQGRGDGEVQASPQERQLKTHLKLIQKYSNDIFVLPGSLRLLSPPKKVAPELRG